MSEPPKLPPPMPSSLPEQPPGLGTKLLASKDLSAPKSPAKAPPPNAIFPPTVRPPYERAGGAEAAKPEAGSAIPPGGTRVVATSAAPRPTGVGSTSYPAPRPASIGNPTGATDAASPREPSATAAPAPGDAALPPHDATRPVRSVPLPERLESNLPSQPAPARRSSSTIAWIVAVALVLGGGIAAYLVARADAGSERAAHADTLVAVGTLRADNAALQARIDALDADRKQLAEEARVKAEALAAMQQTQEELQQRLQAEVAKGSVLISQQHGELVVDLLDQVVFDSGEAELNEKGQAVLWQVGETLARVPDKLIQVSGHTDALRIAGKLEERFPSNWELSTARATQVVRYLQDEVKIPGNRLVAAGLAEYRPIARNSTKAGRSKNRRIEVRLLPMPKS